MYIRGRGHRNSFDEITKYWDVFCGLVILGKVIELKLDIVLFEIKGINNTHINIIKIKKKAKYFLQSRLKMLNIEKVLSKVRIIS